MQNAPTAFPAESLTGLAAGAAPGLPARRGRRAAPQHGRPGLASGSRSRLRLPPHEGVTRGEAGLWGMTGEETLSETALRGTSLSSSLINAITLQRSFPTFVSN